MRERPQEIRRSVYPFAPLLSFLRFIFFFFLFFCLCCLRRRRSRSVDDGGWSNKAGNFRARRHAVENLHFLLLQFSSSHSDFRESRLPLHNHAEFFTISRRRWHENSYETALSNYTVLALSLFKEKFIPLGNVVRSRGIARSSDTVQLLVIPFVVC